MRNLWQDLRYAVRQLRKSPGFTTVAVMTLALGIGTNTAIFSVINAIMLRSLPVHDPQQLVILRWSARQHPNASDLLWGGCPGGDITNSNRGDCSHSFSLFQQIHATQNVFSGTFAFFQASLIVSVNGRSARTEGLFVSGDYFSTLGIRAALGRMLDRIDDTSSAAPSVVLGYNFWRNQLGADPSVVGKSISLNGASFTVVGVAPPGFSGLEPGIVLDLWVPFSAQPRLAPNLPKQTDATLWVAIAARVKPGVTLAQAEAATNGIYVPSVTSGGTPLFKPEASPHMKLISAARGLGELSEGFSRQLFLLMIAVGLVLLIACANVAGLVLARSVSRQKEMAVRLALGATRWRLVRQLITESVLMAAGGAALGGLFAYWGAHALVEFFSMNFYWPLEIDVHPDFTVLGLTAGIAMLSGILVGLAPALRGSKVDVTPALKGSAEGAVTTAHDRARWFGPGQVLVAAQVALAMVVVTGAGLLVRTLANLQTMNVGFETRNLLLFELDTTLTGYNGPKLQQFHRDLRSQLASVPGVISASYSWATLLSRGVMMSGFRPEGAPSLAVAQLPVGPSFFETMRIPILAGRAFAPADFGSAAKEVMVNQMYARQFFGKQNPVGRFVTEWGPKDKWEIIGVTGDTKYQGLREETLPTVYIPLTDGPASFELRTAGDPKALIPAVRSAVSRFNSNLVVTRVKTQTEQVNQTLSHERLTASLSSLFGVLALLLACIGVYGLLAYEVTNRIHEIGIRMALGAQPREILRLILARGLAPTIFGTALGAAVAVGVTRYLQSFLYGIRPTDPLTFAVVSVVLILVALFACYLPARRAMKTDPMVALRYE